jgi:hypothetical protein
LVDQRDILRGGSEQVQRQRDRARGGAIGGSAPPYGHTPSKVQLFTHGPGGLVKMSGWGTGCSEPAVQVSVDSAGASGNAVIPPTVDFQFHSPAIRHRWFTPSAGARPPNVIPPTGGWN